MTADDDAAKLDASRWDAVEDATELVHEERFREALVALREVLRADPSNAYAFYFTAIALFESGEIEPARDAYRACLRITPNHLGARVALCHVLRMLGDLRESIREGLIALTQSPGDADALHAVGLAYLARGDNAAARKYLSAFLEANPEFEAATEVRALLASLDLEQP
jgi:Tfp pilus assembly protein PilF